MKSIIGRGIEFAIVNYLEKVFLFFGLNIIWLMLFHFIPIVILLIPGEYFTFPRLFSNENVNAIFYFYMAIVLLMFSPFTIRFYALNHMCAENLKIKITDYFIGLLKATMQSIVLIGVCLVLFVLFVINIYFYKLLFPEYAYLVYVLGFFLILIYLYIYSCLLNSVAVITYYPRAKIFELFKVITKITNGSLLLSIFHLTLFVVLMYSSLIIIFPFLLFYPSFWGQYQVEQLRNMEERFFNETPREPIRKMKNIFRPWAKN